MDIPDIQVDCVGSTICPRCAATVDVSGLRAFEAAECQSCQAKFAAPGKIGQYVLLRQLSLTEVGATYRGFDTSMSRHVQVNVMRRALRQDKDKVSAFLAEARALASLDNRHTARAFFVGDEDGRPYSVTELIVGDSLETVIAAGKPLNETGVLHTGIDLTGVLAAARKIDLVHGDIRPANVVFVARGMAKLVNFRFAGAAGRRATQDAPPIEPPYASPEHIDGRKIDARSDVFSLGATLFHALAGCQPFPDGPPHAETPDILSFRPMLRQETADVLAGMLQADPDKRYGADFPNLFAALRQALKASEKPKPVIARLAEAVRPRPRGGVDAAAALAKMREARRAGLERPASPKTPGESADDEATRPTSAPAAAEAGTALPIEVLPAEPPAAEPLPIQVLPEQTDGRTVLPLQVADARDGDKPGKRKLTAALTASAIAAGVMIGFHSGLFRPDMGTRPGKSSPFRGKIGLGTRRTAAEFKDVRVTRGQSVLFEASFGKDGAPKWKPLRGKWTRREDVYRQEDVRLERAMAVAGDASWADYTLGLKARKLHGKEGFQILFRCTDEKNFYLWNIGGWGNRHHGVQRVRNGDKLIDVHKRVNGKIDRNKWYDIRIKLDGPRIRCHLDGKLIHDFEVK